MESKPEAGATRHVTAWQDKLDELSEKILRLGGLVEQAIDRSVRALTERDRALAEQVIGDDVRIDTLELEIDALCVELLALQQPLASDLRFITTAMKITPDLERMGDHAVNISQRSVELGEEPPIPTIVDMPAMARDAQAMVGGALDAFVKKDPARARAIIEMDDALDRRMEQTFRILTSQMIEDPRLVSRAIRLTFIAKYFERIGDQATNICEQVVYMCEAKVVKHAFAQRLADEDE